MQPPDEVDGLQADDFAHSSVDLDVVLMRTTPRRVRVARTIGVVMVIALVIVVIWRPSFPLFRAVMPLTATSNPQATLTLVTNVLSGVLTVDGHASPKPAFILKQGKHTLKYESTPFLPIMCTISLPNDDKDTCQSQNGGRLRTSVGQIAGVAFTFTPEMLPAQIKQQLLDTLTQAAANITTTRSTVVRVGESYATQDTSTDGVSPSFHVREADEPLTARFGTMLVRDEGCWQGRYCWEGEVEGGDWLVSVDFLSYVNFANSAGEEVGAFQSDPEYKAVPLRFDAQTLSWSVVQGYLESFAWLDCVPHFDLADYGPDASIHPKDENGVIKPYETMFIDMSHGGIEGCFTTIGFEVDGDAKPFAQGSFLVRFGALLAIDEAAHQMFPNIPYATADEIALVSALATPWP